MPPYAAPGCGVSLARETLASRVDIDAAWL